MEIKIGDTVWLNSSPSHDSAMSVQEIAEEYAWCIWKEGVKLKRAKIPLNGLTLEDPLNTPIERMRERLQQSLERDKTLEHHPELSGIIRRGNSEP